MSVMRRVAVVFILGIHHKSPHLASSSLSRTNATRSEFFPTFFQKVVRFSFLSGARARVLFTLTTLPSLSIHQFTRESLMALPTVFISLISFGFFGTFV